MSQNRQELPDVPRDPAVKDAFDAFIHQTHVPLDFHACGRGGGQQQPARRGRWVLSEHWWWTHDWSPLWAAAVIVALLLAGGGVWYWDTYQREHVDYYAQVITRWGLPEGVGRLTV